MQTAGRRQRLGEPAEERAAGVGAALTEPATRAMTSANDSLPQISRHGESPTQSDQQSFIEVCRTVLKWDNCMNSEKGGS